MYASTDNEQADSFQINLIRIVFKSATFTIMQLRITNKITNFAVIVLKPYVSKYFLYFQLEFNSLSNTRWNKLLVAF